MKGSGSVSYRRLITLTVLLLITFITCLPAGQARVMLEKDITIFMDGKQLVFPDQQPFIDSNDRTMVPARFFAEALGAAVSWNEAQQQATITRDASILTLTVDKQEVLIHPNKTEKMDTVATIRNSRLLVPLRFISTYLDCDVSWDATERIAHVFTQGQDQTEQLRLIEAAGKALLELPTVNSEKNMQDLLDESDSAYDKMRNTAGSGMTMDMVQEDSNTMKQAPAPTIEAASDYSGTNVQVKGVDEADIVKTDGEYLYQVRNNEILLIKAYPAAELSVKSRIQLEENPQDIFIDDNRLVVISNDYSGYPYRYESGMVSDLKIMPPYQYRNSLIISTYDTSSKTQPLKLDTFKMEGNYLSSRKIGSSIYIISSESVYTPYKPVYYINNTRVEKPYSEIRYFPDIIHDSYLNIARINLNSTSDKFQQETYLTSGSNIYCSTDNLYVTAVEYDPVYYLNDYSTSRESTLVFKFNLDNGIKYSAKGTVPGTLLNQFSMDEHNGYFRIATTTNQWSSTNSQNAVYILNNNLNTANSVTGIAPGEKIYSTRFLGERLYMVTFKQLDPFFVIDLNPQSPKVLGKLKIPGFSDYLHPYEDHYILGLGYDTALTKQGGVIQGGVKLSMFDVSDVANPVEIDQVVIGTSGSSSEACDNHRAFLLYNDILAFPAAVYENNNNDSYYGTFEFQGAYIYSVSENGLSYKGRVTHLNSEDYLKAGDYWYDSSKNVRRTVIIAGNLYTISNDQIKANDCSSLQELNHLSTID